MKNGKVGENRVCRDRRVSEKRKKEIRNYGKREGGRNRIGEAEKSVFSFVSNGSIVTLLQCTLHGMCQYAYLICAYVHFSVFWVQMKLLVHAYLLWVFAQYMRGFKRALQEYVHV